jgi:hypothetical protein
MWWFLLLLPGAAIAAGYMRWRTLAARARWAHENTVRYARWAREDEAQPQTDPVLPP